MSLIDQHGTRRTARRSNTTIGQGTIAKYLYLADPTKLERGKERILPHPLQENISSRIYKQEHF